MLVDEVPEIELEKEFYTNLSETDSEQMVYTSEEKLDLNGLKNNNLATAALKEEYRI